MPDLKVICPSCSALLKLANPSLAGKNIRCPKCQSIVSVLTDTEALDSVPAERDKSKSSSSSFFALTVLFFLLVGSLIAGAYFALDWYNEQHAIRPMNPNTLVVKPRPAGQPARGFPTPDAVLDAYVQALREGNVSACKATMTRERLSHDVDYLSKSMKPPIDPEALDKKFLDTMNYYKGREWKEGEFKRFPIEYEGENQALVICVFQNNAKGKKDRYRKYVFVKEGRSWLQSDWKDGDAKELDRERYSYTWDKK